MSDYPNYAKLKQELSNQRLPALAEAGLLPEDAIDYLETYRDAYEPNQGVHYQDENEDAYWYYNSKQYNDIVRKNVGKALSRAVQNGNQSLVEHAVGLADDETNGLGPVDYEKLSQLIEKPSLLLLLFGDTGSGKTFTGVSLAELWQLRVGGTILTNIQSLAEAEEGVVYADNLVDLIRYCLDNPRERKLLLADELSSLMSGYGIDRQDVETFMRPFVRKMRKEPFRMSIIGIGHRPGDIHPTLRNGELAYPAFKRSHTEMEIFETVEDEEKSEPAKMVINGIKPPSMTVDTDDDGTWHWPSDREALEVAKELDQAGYGDILRWLDEFGDDDDDEEKDSMEAPQCQAATNDGHQCPNDAKLPAENPLVCKNHRHRMDEI